MTPTAKFVVAVLGLTAAVLGVGALAGLVVWSALDGAAQQAVSRAVADRVAALTLLAAVVAAAVAWALTVPFRRYVQPVQRLEEATRTVRHANPARRPIVRGAPEVRRLARAITDLADDRDELADRVADRVCTATREIDAERQRLAALIAQLPRAVVVANADGRVLLYNRRAVELLGDVGDVGAGGDRGGVGLARSLEEALPRAPLDQALARAEARRLNGETAAAVQTVVTAAGGLLRIHLAPLVGESGEREGTVLTADDVTEPVAASQRREAAIRRLVGQGRAAVDALTAALETLRRPPATAAAERDHLLDGLEEHARRLSVALDVAAADLAEPLEGAWLLETVPVGELCAAVAARLQSAGLGAPEVFVPDDELTVRADPDGLGAALAGAVELAAQAGPLTRVDVAAWREADLVLVEVAWSGAMPDAETWRRWQDHEPLGPDGSTLTALIERHAGEVVHSHDADHIALRLLLPAVEPARAPERPVAPRPEFYDFRLFTQPPPAAEIADVALGRLACTVLDTETTGLRPDEGDAIVSVGAVRVVAGRVLRHERFARLVDPCRPVPEEAVRVHGLTRELLAGRPTAATVLADLAVFCTDTVVVGHNVEFDLRFVAHAARHGDPPLCNPVLDTLLLSVIAYPSHTDHSLEALAGRLGLEPVARHTAIGDAVLTAEAFVRLLPLLAERGVVTLADAQRAAARAEAHRAGGA